MYGYVQRGFAVFTGNTLTWQGATGAGNLLVVAFCKANNATSEFVASVAGNVNTTQSGWQTAVGALNNVSCKIITGASYATFATATLLYLPGGSNAGGDTTTTVTLAGDQGGNVFVCAMEFSGIASASPFINYSLNAQTAPGTGTDAVTSNNVNVSSVPALLAGFSFWDGQVGGTPTGTGFSGRGLDATTAPWYMFGEDKRITSSGNVACTFTDTNASGDVTLAIGMAFAEPASGGGAATQGYVPQPGPGAQGPFNVNQFNAFKNYSSDAPQYIPPIGTFGQITPPGPGIGPGGRASQHALRIVSFQTGVGSSVPIPTWALVKWVPIELAVRLRYLQHGTLNIGNTHQNLLNLTALAKTEANGAAHWARWDPSIPYKLQVLPQFVPGYVAPPGVR